MIYPLVFRIGSASIPAHAVFEVLAYTLGYRFYVYQRKKQGDRISDEGRTWIFLGAAAGALIGSHGLGMLERPWDSSIPFLTQWMGTKTVVGGFLGGLFGVELTKKILGISHSSGDLMTYPLLLALFVGRTGCHFAGLTDGTHGLPVDLPWAVDFGDGIRRHPVNLYEIIWIGFTALFIYRKEKQKNPPLQDGAKFKIFLILYLIWRFFVEWLKPVWFWPFGLSSIQCACLIGLFYYLWLYFRAKILPIT